MKKLELDSWSGKEQYEFFSRISQPFYSVSFRTSLTNERDFDKDDAIPQITWGKYSESGGRRLLGMSVELNHRFADGAHIGSFYSKLCELIKKLA